MGFLVARTPLMRAAFDQPHAMRFRFLFSCMSLSQNRCTPSGQAPYALTYG